MIRKARKKPVEIEYVHFTDYEKGKDIINWMEDEESYVQHKDNEVYLMINTLEGLLRANIDDYVVKGVHGEFYAVKPDIFHKTYEVIEEEA